MSIFLISFLNPFHFFKTGFSACIFLEEAIENITGSVSANRQQVIDTLKNTDKWETKVKLGIPFINLLGQEVSIETKFNLKKKADEIAKKFGHKLFII